MADRIQGITIEIGGDVTGLNAALKDVNKQSGHLQTELKDIDRLLKLDPTNTELLSQKQKLLADAVGNTKTKLDALKDAERQVQEQVKNGNASEEQYRALQREIVSTEQNLKSLETKTKDFGSVTAQQMKIAGKEVSEFGDKVAGAGQKFAPVSAAAAGIIGGLAATAVQAGKTADDINTLAKQTGLSTEMIQKFSYASDIIDVDLETVTGSMAKLTKNMATAQKGTGDAANAFKTLGVSITNNDGSLRNNQEVFEETIKKLGEMENETQRDAYAMQIFGKSAQDLNPLILGGADALKKLGEEAEAAGLIMSQDALDAANAFNDELDTLKATAKGTFQQLGTEIGTALLPIMEVLIEMMQGALEWLRNLDSGAIQIILAIVAVVAAIGPLLIIIGQMAMGIGAIITILPALSAAFTAVTGPVGLTVAAIAALVGTLLYLWNTNDGFRTAVLAIWESIKVYITEFVEIVKVIIGEVTGFLQENFGFMWEAIITAFNAFKSLFEGDFKGFFTQIIAAAGTWISGFTGIGENIVKGIWKGIQNLASWFYNQIASFFSSLVEKAKEAVRIHSPSTVFAEMGRNMVLGLDQGWNKEISTAQRSIYGGMESLANVNQSNVNNSRSIIQNVSIIATKAIDEMETLKQIRQQGVLMQMQVEG